MLKSKWLILTNFEVQKKTNLEVYERGCIGGRVELIKAREKNGRKKRRGGRMRV